MNEQVKQMYAGKISGIRNLISQMINTMRNQNPFSRQYSLAITDLQRAFHTLGESKGALGLESPYKESYNPNSPVIEPTDDYILGIFPEINDLTTQVEVVKAIRGKLKIFMENLEEIEKDCNSEDSKEFLEEVRKARMWVREAKNWMGWELRVLEIEYNNRDLAPGDRQYVPKPIKPLPEELPKANPEDTEFKECGTITGEKLPDVNADTGMIFIKEDPLPTPEKVTEAILQAPIEFAPEKADTVSEAKLPDANQDIEELIDKKQESQGSDLEGNVTINTQNEKELETL